MIAEWISEKSENLGDKAGECFRKADEEKGLKKLCTFSAGVLKGFASGALEAIPDACIWGYGTFLAIGLIAGATKKK